MHPDLGLEERKRLRRNTREVAAVQVLSIEKRKLIKEVTHRVERKVMIRTTRIKKQIREVELQNWFLRINCLVKKERNQEADLLMKTGLKQGIIFPEMINTRRKRPFHPKDQKLLKCIKARLEKSEREGLVVEVSQGTRGDPGQEVGVDLSRNHTTAINQNDLQNLEVEVFPNKTHPRARS